MELTTVNVDKEIQNEVTIQVAIEMPFDIRSITCPTHKVRMKVFYFHLIFQISEITFSIIRSIHILIKFRHLPG